MRIPVVMLVCQRLSDVVLNAQSYSSEEEEEFGDRHPPVSATFRALRADVKTYSEVSLLWSIQISTVMYVPTAQCKKYELI